MANLESQKKELLLSVNAFNKPTELVGSKAWAQLILGLIFLKPGTYPSIPDMGVGIQDYEYDFADSAAEILQTRISEQVSRYLPDIQVDGINVSTTQYQGRTIMMIAIQLVDDGQVKTYAVASEVTDRLIDFDISWV